jgi:hypothetical protein
MAWLLALLPGCGYFGDHPAHPTDPVHIQQTMTGEVSAHAWICAGEFPVLDGPLRAQVTPGGLYLELRTGSCSTAGDLLASSAVGSISLNLQSYGFFHVQIGNPTSSAARYSLDVDYYTPSI